MLVLLLLKVRVNLNSTNGTSFHTFPLVKKAHVITRDHGIHLVGRLVTSMSQPTNMAGDFAREL